MRYYHLKRECKKQDEVALTWKVHSPEDDENKTVLKERPVDSHSYGRFWRYERLP